MCTKADFCHGVPPMHEYLHEADDRAILLLARRGILDSKSHGVFPNTTSDDFPTSMRIIQVGREAFTTLAFGQCCEVFAAEY